MSKNPNPSQPASQGTQQASEPIPYAVIAAAIASVLPSSYRLIAVSPGENPFWSMEGRRQIFSSHHFQRR